MRNAIVSIIVIALIAAFALAQVPAPPQTPVAPKAPKAPVAPKAPHTPVGIPRGSYLGVDSKDVTPERMEALKLKSDQGVEILMVDQDAPAGKAGLKEHDVILSFDGKPVQDVEQLRQMIRNTRPGTKVTLGISREGQLHNVVVQLADRRKVMVAGDHVIHIPRIEIPPMPEIDVPSFTMLEYSHRNGLMVENLTRQLGEYFGAKDGHGVLVRSVEKNSPAEQAGFKAGDVIIRIGNEPVESMSDWNQILRQQPPGKIPVTVIRERREQVFTLAIPERHGNRSSRGTYSWDGDDFNREIANLGPEIQREMDAARAEMQKAFSDQNVQDELRKSTTINQRELRKQLERAHREVEKAMKNLEQQKIKADDE
jgi:serine protease Do